MFRHKRFNTISSGRVSGPGTLGTVNVNTGATGAVLTIYDAESATGAPVAVVDASAPISRFYGIYCSTGIFADLATANADITIGYA